MFDSKIEKTYVLSQVSEFLANRIFAEIEICKSEYDYVLWCPTQKEWHVEIDAKNQVSFVKNDFVFHPKSWDEFHNLILTLGEIQNVFQSKSETNCLEQSAETLW